MSGMFLRKSAIAAGALAMSLGAGAPALAGGYSAHFSYYSGYHGPSHYGYGHHYGYSRRHYGHHRSYGHYHHGGGNAAAIALGVIGGAIIINELAESRARERAYDRAYEERYVRYDPYARRAAPLRYDPPDYEDDYYAPEDLGPRDGALGEDDIDRRLEGGPAPIRISALDAYETCTDHARRALSAQGYVLAAPAEPETAENLGDAWKLTATVLAEDRRGGWSRAMYCEADEGRVYLLELI
jgi:hypothetical protein